MNNFKNVLKITIIIPLLFLITTFNSQRAKAEIKGDSNQTYILEEGDFKIEDFDYKNNTKTDQTIKITTSTYDIKNHTTTSDKTFVAVSQPNITLKAGETKTIKYIISVPSDQTIGTYSNILNIQIVKNGVGDQNTITQNLVNNMAILFTIQIEDNTTTYTKSFIKDSDTKLIVENPGFPYITPMTIKYVYTNNSKYVFMPHGKLEVFENGATLPVTTFNVSNESTPINPNENISQVFTLDTWKDINNILLTKKISIKTYNGTSDSYVTNEVEVNILPQLIAVGILGVSIILLIIVVTISMIKALFNAIKMRLTKNTK